MARLALHHPGYEEVAAVDHAAQVDAEQPVEVVERGVEEAAADRDSRVVDHDVDRRDLGVDQIGELAHLGAVGDVDPADHERAAPSSPSSVDSESSRA